MSIGKHLEELGVTRFSGFSLLETFIHAYVSEIGLNN